MIKIKHFILILILALAASTACSNESSEMSDSKYYRTECIVAVEVSYNMADSTYITAVNDSMAKELHAFRMKDTDFKLGYAFTVTKESASRSFYYLQFLKNCEHRLELATELMTNIWDKGNTLATYSVLTKQILPGPSTIDVDGSWKDKSEFNF